MRFKIIADSCTDPVPGLKDAPEYTMVPLLIRVGGQEFVDNGTMPTEELIQRMADSAEGTSTACPAPQWYMDAFEGDEDVFVITLSAELSGSYNSAMQARAMFLEEHPDKNIHVFNSHSACAGQSALLIKVFELCRAGLSFEKVVEETNHFIAHLTTLFVLENLDNLRKNGRLTEIQAIITGALHIKLVMEGTPAGTINKVGQALSMKQAMSKMGELAVERAKRRGGEQRTLVISHCNCLDRAIYMRNFLMKKFDFEKVEIVRTGGISTVYAGDGGVVVAF
jgi:DegV family protein with EDD domain